MITISVLINAFSDRYIGYKVEGKARPVRNTCAYLMAKTEYKVLHEKFNSAKLKTDEIELFEVWDIRENKQAQAAMDVFNEGAKMLAKESPMEVTYELITKFDK